MVSTGAEVATLVAFLIIATAVLILRCDIRYRILKNHGLDDVLVILAWCFAFSETSLIALNAGHPRKANLKIFLCTLLLHNFTLTCSKLSILVQFCRVFPSPNRTAKACRIGIVVLVINALVQTVLIIFHCQPVSAFWDVQLLEEGRGICSSSKSLFYPSSIANLLTSIMVFGIPLPSIYNLRLGCKAKISLMIVFGFGFVDLILSVVRIVLTSISDPVVRETGGTWSSLESTIAIICASAGALRPFISQSFSRFLFAVRNGRAVRSTYVKEEVDGTDSRSGESV
ncbi:hypothetical protein BLS_001061 [Venturia inaequalis]|uniref:Rhodopsin domain-containing protein n=1 Tax=Venturia inaequalis TaxID=5025 RepID=A0A8H3YXP0_VENIN|nr:hypothetical protein BLS_001061 [Venturia inaequalis]